MNKIILSFLITIISGLSLKAQTLDIPEVQYSLVTKRTATWCPNCGNYAWDMMENITNNYNDKSISIKAHHSSSSNLYSSTAKDLIDNIESSFYQPVFYVGEANFGNGSSTVENNIISAIESNFTSTPTAQSGLEITHDPSDGTIAINVETQFFTATEGDYRLSLFVIEKEVVATQANRGTNTTHTNVLRTNLNGNGFEGPLVSGSVSMNQVISSSFSTSVGAENIPALDNMLIAAVIWQFDGSNETQYKFINVNFTDVVSTVSSTNQLSQTDATIKLFPTVTTTTSTLQIEATTNLENAQIVTIAPDGRVVNQLFSGSLNAGIHSFQVNAADLSAKGTYLVGIRTNKGQKTIPLIIK